MDFKEAEAIVNAGGACARPTWKGELLVGMPRLGRKRKDEVTEKMVDYKPEDQGFLRRFYPKNHPKYPAGNDLFFDQDDYRADVAATDWEDVSIKVQGKNVAKTAVEKAVG